MTARKTETAKSVTIEFDQERDTPGTVRFKEIVPDDDVAKVKTLYIQKFCAVKELGNAQKIRVTIEAIG